MNKRCDIVVLNETDLQVFLIVAGANSNKLLDNHKEKQAKYVNLSTENEEMWHVNTVEVHLIIIVSVTTFHKTKTKVGLHKSTFVEI